MTHNEAAPVRYTFEEYARLPDDGYRTELVRGMVVREPQPVYVHGRVQARLLYHLEAFIERSGLALVCVGPIGSILARNPDTVRGPDAAVIRAERLPPGHHVGFLDGAPDLVIEIVSPSNTARQIREKVTDYLTAGAKCVWVIDPRRRNAMSHASRGEALQLRAPDELACEEVLPGFRLKLSELFGAAI